MKKARFKNIVFSIILIQLSCNPNLTNPNSKEIKLTSSLLDSFLLKSDFENDFALNEANNLSLIYQLNSIKIRIGQDDTIKVFQDGKNYRAKYKGEFLNLKERNIKEDSLITLWGSKEHISRLLICETFENDRSQRITVSTRRTKSVDQSIKIENFKNEVLSGEYKEMTFDGKIITLGNYELKDSIYQDTIVFYDEDTYEEIVELKDRNYVGVKCGKWLYQTINGRIETSEANCK